MSNPQITIKPQRTTITVVNGQGPSGPSGAIALAAHVADVDPHTQYTTAAEVIALIGSNGGGGGSTANYTHTQSTLSSTWNINHGLGRKPSITIFYGGQAIEGTVIHNSDNAAVATFSQTINGSAYCI